MRTHMYLIVIVVVVVFAGGPARGPDAGLGLTGGPGAEDSDSRVEGGGSRALRAGRAVHAD